MGTFGPGVSELWDLKIYKPKSYFIEFPALEKSY